MTNIHNIIKQLREAEEKATKGEWFASKSINTNSTFISNKNERLAEIYPAYEDGKYQQSLDASLIVLMRNNLIPLLDYVEELQEKIGIIPTKCDSCGKRKEDVSCRDDAYAQEVGNDANAMHTVCDECDYQNRMDI